MKILLILLLILNSFSVILTTSDDSSGLFSQFLILTTGLALVFLVLVYSPINVNQTVEYIAYLFLLITVIIVFVCNQVIVPIQNLLIFLLALQRFLLYFCPNSEKYIVPSGKSFKVIISSLYFVSILGNVLYSGYLVKCYWMNFFAEDKTCSSFWSILHAAICIFLDFLVIFSSIFYICILISVRKITKLSSTIMKKRPEKVIEAQTFVLLIVKLLCFPLLIFASMLLIERDITLDAVINVIYYPLFIIDVLTTPIVFQITYIFCNKTNLEILLKMNFRKVRTWMSLCCGVRSNRVEQTELYNMSTMSGSTVNT
ncbi:unnamed protein product [Caenorhabditis angaria]|uniref:G-protein coupled receptors family 1 profile domain-containing protein n=1 Tax=Caenorhabditis angaria TaxID=860376 RepID=A0A9P1N5F6_9PELO|nr:unnamed protein product [Caenorhabditis angaria]